LESLDRTVREQNLSAEEVIQMNTSHETLSQAVRELEKKLADTRAQLMSLEVTVTNRATAAEEAVDFYNGMLVSLQILPAREDELDIGLELNTAADSPDQLLVGPDLRRVVRPALNRIAEERRRDREDVESERIAVDHEVDGLAADCDVVQAEIAAVSKEVARLTEEADAIREVRLIKAFFFS
jgi:kinetochore protein NDC80